VAPAIEPLLPGDDQLDRERVIEVEADVGAIWLEREAELLTPTVLEEGAWAPDTISLMRRVLRPGMTFVDAGANVGYHSVLASKLVGQGGRVVCIEVDPANIAILRANLWKNGCTNAQVLPVAAWSARTELKLRRAPEGGAASTVSSGDGSGEYRIVPAFRLDELIEGPVHYLKVDCEGTDHVVINGASGLFDANPEMIATVEFVPDNPSHTGDTPREILDTYQGLELRPYRLSHWGRMRPTSYGRLARSGSRKRLVVYDFVLTRTRQTRRVLAYFLAEWVFPKRLVERLLKLGGDLLEHVPARIRPRIRRRDRRSGG
jgi:FkbM family methyltransferase